MSKKCCMCGVVKPLTDFYKASRRKDGYQTQCKVCAMLYKKEKRDLVREKINKYKLDNGCVDCGYNKHPHAIEFDHLPGFEKSKGVAAMLSQYYTWEQIQKEIEKCELVCANCHRIRTATRAEWEI